MAVRAAWRDRLLNCGEVRTDQQVRAQNGCGTDTESTATYRMGMQSGAEVRWFAGQPLIAVRNQPCTRRTTTRWPGNLRRGKAASGRTLAPDGAVPVGAGWSGHSASWYG